MSKAAKDQDEIIKKLQDDAYNKLQEAEKAFYAYAACLPLGG